MGAVLALAAWGRTKVGACRKPMDASRIAASCVIPRIVRSPAAELPGVAVGDPPEATSMRSSHRDARHIDMDCQDLAREISQWYLRWYLLGPAWPAWPGLAEVFLCWRWWICLKDDKRASGAPRVCRPQEEMYES